MLRSGWWHILNLEAPKATVIVGYVSVDDFMNLRQLENSKVDVQGVSLKRGFTELAPDPKGSAVHPGRLSVQRIYDFVPEGPQQNVDYGTHKPGTVCHCQQNEPTSCKSVSLSIGAAMHNLFHAEGEHRHFPEDQVLPHLLCRRLFMQPSSFCQIVKCKISAWLLIDF